MRPTSTGYLALRSADPTEHPLIEPNYLATEGDREEMRDAVNLTGKIFAQKAFDPYRGDRSSPGPVGCGVRSAIIG